MKSFIKKNPKVTIDLYTRMKKIRLVEETIAARYNEWKMRCPTHLCTGQEAIASGVCAAIKISDFVLSTHRCHGHYLAKGGDLNKMMAEIYGKRTGCSRGKGGSMHLIDKKIGFMGSTAIVGGTIPIAVGLGLSIRLKKTKQISVAFFGDGAVEEGAFYESVNFAVLKNLPVLFICENNLFSVYSPLIYRQPKNRKIFEMVQGMGCKAAHGDGNNAIEVYQKVSEAVKHMRKNGGPYFFEFATYRWREHCGPNFDNDLGYRCEKEYLVWKKRDPLEILGKEMIRAGLINKEKISLMENNIKKNIDAAFRFAESSPYPDDSEAFAHLYNECEAICQI